MKDLDEEEVEINSVERNKNMTTKTHRNIDIIYKYIRHHIIYKHIDTSSTGKICTYLMSAFFKRI